jgi:hypothetical protein
MRRRSKEIGESVRDFADIKDRSDTRVEGSELGRPIVTVARSKDGSEGSADLVLLLVVELVVRVLLALERSTEVVEEL